MSEFFYRSSPEPAKSGRFMYDGNGLRFGGVARASVRDLELLFRKNAGKERRRQATKDWITAQLQLYGVVFAKNGKVADLKATLESAVKKSGKNKFGPTAAITSLESSLAEKYRENIRVRDRKVAEQKAADFANCTTLEGEVSVDPEQFVSKHFLDEAGKPAPQKTKSAIILREVCTRDLAKIVDRVPGLSIHDCSDAHPLISVVAWAEHLAAGVDAAFASLQDVPRHSPWDDSCRARFDFDRFLAMYFLDGLRGNPDPSRTKETVELYSWSCGPARLATAVWQIPGLHICDTDDGRALIGWGKERVEGERDRANQAIKDAKQKEEEEKAARLQQEWDEDWAKYQAMHNDYRKRAGHQGQEDRGPLTLNDIPGVYAVRIKKIETHYRSTDLSEYHFSYPLGTSSFIDAFTLTICKPSYADAGGTVPDGCEASFWFGLIKGVMILAFSDDKLHAFRERLQADSDAEEPDSDSEFQGTASWNGTYSGLGKRRAEPAGPNLAVRRRLGETPVPGKVYFQWAGSGGKGYLEEDDGIARGAPEHVGSLTFSPCGTRAVGEWQYPGYFGANQPVHLELLRAADPSEDKDETAATSSWKEFHEFHQWGK